MAFVCKHAVKGGCEPCLALIHGADVPERSTSEPTAITHSTCANCGREVSGHEIHAGICWQCEQPLKRTA